MIFLPVLCTFYQHNHHHTECPAEVTLQGQYSQESKAISLPLSNDEFRNPFSVIKCDTTRLDRNVGSVLQKSEALNKALKIFQLLSETNIDIYHSSEDCGYPYTRKYTVHIREVWPERLGLWTQDKGHTLYVVSFTLREGY